jgi:oligopeptide/dipeptide ABC transporter ATP-binding protein
MNSLNPVLKVGDQVAEPMIVHYDIKKEEALAQAAKMFQHVGVPLEFMQRYAFELSGGMRQRVALAMALMCQPRLLFADEPTTALDVSVQARVLELLARARDRGLGILIITHDLGVVAGLADRVAVMYAGRLVETATTARLFAAPTHPYTAALLAAVPRLHGQPAGRLPAIAGYPPRPGEVGPGCAFAPRCPRASDECQRTRPALQADPLTGSAVACHHALPPVPVGTTP